VVQLLQVTFFMKQIFSLWYLGQGMIVTIKLYFIKILLEKKYNGLLDLFYCELRMDYPFQFKMYPIH